jgi:hypothetical protein
MTREEKAEDARRNYAVALHAMAHRNDKPTTRNDLIPETRKRLAAEAGGLARDTDFNVTSITETVTDTPRTVPHEATDTEIAIAHGINIASDAQPLVPRYPAKTAFAGISKRETA